MEYLQKIKNEKMKKAVLKAYSKYGYHLYFLPSSLTGRHHPQDERGTEGLKKHVEKVCWFLEGVANEFQFSDAIRDILFTAAYFHDLGKVYQTKIFQELEYEGTKITRKVRLQRQVRPIDTHPLISAKLARKFLTEEGVDSETIDIISKLIMKHMGHWYKNLPQPTTELEKYFALADYMVSREDFKIEKRRSLWERIKNK